MKVRQKKWIRFRIVLVAIGMILGLGVVVTRAFHLQVLERQRLAEMARKGYVHAAVLPPERGTIYDRDGHALAVSVEVGSVYAHPKRVTDKAEAANALGRVLSEDPAEILKALTSEANFVWIQRKAPSAVARQAENLNLEGVGTVRETGRYYPGREIAAHLVGFVGTDNQGLEGLEKKYDQALTGPPIQLIRMRDALGRPFAVTRPGSADQQMHSLVLTIDKDIQYRAQRALEAAVSQARAKGGQCVIVDPHTGEVLAAAVVPGFNPNVFLQYPRSNWRNRVITDTFEPGSTMKAFLLAAGLAESAVTPSTRFDCEQGAFQLGGHTINDVHKYGVLSVADIVVHSSNIGALKIGQKLGYETYARYLGGFGFGEPTGVDLLGERSGFVRSAKATRPIDEATVFFGQGLTVTSLQLTMAMAAIANGGKLLRPYVVKTMVDEGGRVVKENYPRVVRRVISTEIARTVSGILQEVTGTRGTAPRAAIEGFQVAGKTGTAQKVDPKTKLYSKNKFIALFVGFVPVERPRLVVLVMVDEPRGTIYGGTVAAPVFRDVAGWALHYMRVEPDLQPRTQTRTAVQRSVPAKTVALAAAPEGAGDRVPDFRGLGMREVLRKGQALGLHVVPEGSGVAVKQEPKPGAAVQSAGRLRVWFSPPG